MRIGGVNIVFVLVENVEASRAFYGEVIGLGRPAVESPSWVEWNLPGGVNFAVQKAGEGILEGIVPARSSVKFSFAVEGIRELYDRLFENGVRVASEPRDNVGVLLFECLDPDGNVIQFVEPRGK